MKKNFILLGLCSTLFLGGCSSFSITKYFNKDDFYLKSIQETKKVDIIVKNEVKALFTATYLNAVDKKFDGKSQNFIVGIYIVNNQNKKHTSQSKLTLNGKESIEMKPLEKGHQMANSLPLKNNWAKYYVVKFDKEEKENTLKLAYQYANFPSVYLSFQATH